MNHRGVLLISALLLAASAFAQDAQQQQPHKQSGPIRIDPAYSRTANQTGGQVWVMDRTKVADAMKIIELTSRGQQDALFSANDHLNGSEHAYAVHVDTENARLLVSVTGTKDFNIHRPNGSPVGKQENIVEYLEAANGAVYAIDNPEAGSWRVALRGNGDITLRVNAVRRKDSSAVEFDRFEFVELGGRPGHEGMFKIQGNPLAGRESEVEARLAGDIGSVHFELRSPGGALLKSFLLHKSRKDSSDYAGKVLVPEAPFVVYAVGADQRGTRFQRVRSQQVNPQPFRVTAPRYWELKRGTDTPCTVEVTNYGPRASFQVTVTSLKHLVRDIAPKTFDLDTNASVKLTLTFNSDVDEKVPGESLVILVQRANTEQTNFAIIEAEVARP